MKPQDLEEALRAGGVTLTMDTNVVSGGGNRFRRYIKIVQAVKNLNARFERPGRDPIEVAVSALIHFEVMFDLRQVHGLSFDPARISSGLANAGLLVRDFDRAAAERVASVLARWFPESEEWAAEKRGRFLRAVGLDAEDHRYRNRGFPATVDWPIAAQAESDDHILITNDKGTEFKRVRRRVDLGTLEKALQALLSDQDSSSQAG